MINIPAVADPNRAPQANLAPAVQESLLGTVQRVFLRTITSYLFIAVACAAVGFTAFALGGAAGYAIAGYELIITLLFLAVFKDPLYTEVSLIYNSIYFYLRGYPWWSQITQNLFVGAIPLQNFGHLEQLRALGQAEGAQGISIVSINTLPEVRDSGVFHAPVMAMAWDRAGVPNRRFDVADRGAVPREMLQEVVTHVEQEIAAGRRVYLHCLFGKGRSVSIAEAYLLHQDIIRRDHAIRDAEAQGVRPLPNEPVLREEAVYNQIRGLRPQAGPNADQRASVFVYREEQERAFLDARRQARRDRNRRPAAEIA